jgi:GTP:adenosylcobinamide-phosphate guanylyltransferase
MSHTPLTFRRDKRVHDLAENFEELEIQALVASGDCFEMLASDLDRVTHNLDEDTLEYLRVEHTIRILLYLQRHYKITKKYFSH